MLQSTLILFIFLKQLFAVRTEALLSYVIDLPHAKRSVSSGMMHFAME